MARKNNATLHNTNNKRGKRKTPANSVFSSRDAETEAMLQLRNTGHSNAEIAHRCGVSVRTIITRIGTQPHELTIANKKLAGKVRSAKLKIKMAIVHRNTIEQYNAKVLLLNQKMEEAKKMEEEVKQMKKQAAYSSKVIKMPLEKIRKVS